MQALPPPDDLRHPGKNAEEIASQTSSGHGMKDTSHPLIIKLQSRKEWEHEQLFCLG